MDQRSTDALARTLAAERPGAIDPEALAAVDQEELAAALQRIVADLPPTEQRTRLARAFRAIAMASERPMSERPPPAPPDSTATGPERRPTTIDRSVSMRHFTPVRAGMLAAMLIGALVGVLAGVWTGAGDSEAVAVPAAAQAPVPVLDPIARGTEPPSSDALAGLFPPDAEARVEAAQAAIGENPELAEELDETELDSSIDDSSASSGTFVVDRFSGYVDGTAAFGDGAGSTLDDGGGADETADGGTSDGDGGDGGDAGEGEAGEDEGADAGSDRPSGTTGTDGAEGGAGGGAGDGGAGDDPPGLIDLCAGDDPPDGCDGVPGTVTLMTVPAFRFVVEPTVTPFWPACGVDGTVAEDEFVVMLMTNNLGDFTVRYRATGTAGEYHEISGSAPEAWRAYRDGLDDGTEPVIVTCLIAERTGPEHRLELDITGTGDQDSGSVRWTGVVELGLGREVATRRDGRPSVTVEPLTASELLVTVPIGEDENATVTLVPRDEAVGDCDVRPVAAGDARPDLPDSPFSPPDIGDLFDPRMPESEPLHADWSYQRFDLSAPGGGSYLVCVDWFDSFDPPRNLEKASVPVEIAGVSTAELVYAGYEAWSGAGMQPDTVGVTGHVDGPCGSGMVRAGDAPLRSDPAVICHFDSVPVRVGVATSADFGGGASVPGREMIDVEECELTGHWTEEPSCTAWYAASVLTPEGSISGFAVVGVRITGYHGADSAYIGEERPEYTDETDVTGPRLRWDTVSADPAPDDPSSAAIVRWATDVPARVNVILTPVNEAEHCSGRTSPPSELADRGERRFDDLCPAIDYFVSFDARNDGGRTYSGIYADHADLPAEGVAISYRSLPLRTEPLTVEYDYELTFAETATEAFRGSTPGGSTDQGLVPEAIRLVLPADGSDQRYEFSQYYDGHAYFGLDCALPSHYDRSASSVPLTVRGGTFVPIDASFTFSTYLSADDGCPDFMQQARRSALDRAECTAHIDGLRADGASNSIMSMRDGRPAVFHATVSTCPSGTRQFDVQLTVRMREVRTLRGG